jgi:hypothetical protein
MLVGDYGGLGHVMRRLRFDLVARADPRRGRCCLGDAYEGDHHRAMLGQQPECGPPDGVATW